MPQPEATCIKMWGFPFCCCLLAAGGCNMDACFMCGYCCGKSEGEEVANGFALMAGNGGVAMFPDRMGGKKFQTFGTGTRSESAPEQEKM